MDILDGALAFRRSTAVDRAAAPPPAAAAEQQDGATSPKAPPVPGSGDDVSASAPAQGVSLALVVAGGLLAWWMKESQAAFEPKDGFVLLTGFYIAAQAIERLLELAPGGSGTKQAKANRAVVFAAAGFVLAVLLAEWLGLYLVGAVGVGSVDRNLDVIITALAIGGGTKPLHDGIKRIEKAKETPPATT